MILYSSFSRGYNKEENNPSMSFSQQINYPAADHEKSIYKHKTVMREHCDENNNAIVFLYHTLTSLKHSPQCVSKIMTVTFVRLSAMF